jgi:hypothetical protein
MVRKRIPNYTAIYIISQWEVFVLMDVSSVKNWFLIGLPIAIERTPLLIILLGES